MKGSLFSRDEAMKMAGGGPGGKGGEEDEDDDDDDEEESAVSGTIGQVYTVSPILRPTASLCPCDTGMISRALRGLHQVPAFLYHFITMVRVLWNTGSPCVEVCPP